MTRTAGAGIIVGTTDKVVSIDPAGSYDNGSISVQTQVYQYLLNFPAGSTELTPDAASSLRLRTAHDVRLHHQAGPEVRQRQRR